MRLAVGCALALPGRAQAQTAVDDTGGGRPLLIEDAYALPRYAVEVRLAPVRLERLRDGAYDAGLQPGVAFGIVPRTQVELSVPLLFVDAAAGDDDVFGLAGIDVSLFHNLNAETIGLPAFGVAIGAQVPVGELAAGQAHPWLKGVVTRTFRFARLHLNGLYTFGGAPDTTVGRVGATPGTASPEISRWVVGMAADRTFPLQSMLLTGAVYAQRAMHDEADVEWEAAVGIRYRSSPRIAIEGGIGRGLTGSPSWFLTFGTSYAFAVRSLVPLPFR